MALSGVYPPKETQHKVDQPFFETNQPILDSASPKKLSTNVSSQPLAVHQTFSDYDLSKQDKRLITKKIERILQELRKYHNC